ncbi:hypothetical protein B7494_g465 [Chlorociboria aeruginascens]|nr:hypothetical protein B7494_g465 [Chlorociboria aeruginascens]
MPAAKELYKLAYRVPRSHLQATKEAIFATGAGVYADGKYIQVAFEYSGYGQFLPVAEAGANPHTGNPGVLERVEEVNVEIRCTGKDVTKAAVEALKKAHPYEEVGYEVFKMENFDSLEG